MATQDNSWSLEEMNYKLSLVVAVPELEVISCMPSSGIAVCDGQLDYMCRNNIVNRDTNVYNTWLVGSN